MLRTAVLLALAATPALAEPVRGNIDDPSLRGRIDLVYVENVAGRFLPAPTPRVISNQGNTYQPRLTVAVKGAPVIFENLDPEPHYVVARHASNEVLFDEAVLPGGRFERTFNRLGLVHLTCKMHKRMSAYVMVVQNPYFTTQVDAGGAFAIDGLPPGTYTLRVWGEKLSDEENARTWLVIVGEGSTPGRVALK